MRVLSPRIFATARRVLSYRIDRGTPSKKAHASTCPSQNASAVSPRYAFKKIASLCVRLRVAQRMLQRHEHLSPTPNALAHVILHDRVAALEAMLIAKTLEHPLRRVALFAVDRAVTCLAPQFSAIPD